jgi:hypothetical protein
MRWIASIIWALIASLVTNGAIAFVLGGLDHAWVMVAVSAVWFAVFFVVCPKIYDLSNRPTPAG